MTNDTELFIKAEAERGAGNAAVAERLYRCLLDRVPNHVKALRALGDLFQQQGKADQAASTLAAADRIDAENLARGAEGLIGLGHLRKAERGIKRILEVDPNHGEALWVLGQIHRSKGDFPSAIDAYGRVPVSDPRHWAATYIRAILAGHTLWQAPPDSQPRPAPFMVIENFLPQESHDALLEFTFARQGEFQPSLIRSGDYDPDERSSLAIGEPPDAKEWFLPRLKSVLPKVLSRLHMGDVDKSHIELQITAHCDGDFYKPHSDTGEEGEESFTRRLSFVYYYHRTPKRFTGGHLLLYDTFLSGGSFVKGGFSRIEPRDNGIVFFPSQYSHEIEQVRCESKDYRDGRFTLNGWIQGALRVESGQQAEAHYNLGNAPKEQDRLVEAADCRAIGLKSDLAGAHSNLGAALEDQDRLVEAEATFRRTIKLKPDFADAHYNLGIALSKQQGRLAEAETTFRRAIDLKPDFAEAYCQLGDALRGQNRLAGAETMYRRAIELEPDFAQAYFNLGIALSEQGRPAKAEAAYRRAIELEPDFAKAHFNLGNALSEQDRSAKAEAAYRRAIDLEPDFAGAHVNLGNALKEQGRLVEAGAMYRRAIDLEPDLAKAHSALLALLNYRAATDPSALYRAHREWQDRYARHLERPARPYDNTRDPERRLRVGYVSPDFRTHSVSFFFEPLLAAHDRAAVELFCYAEVKHPDDTTNRLKTLADYWRSTLGLTDDEVADLVLADGIDVLVDLAGHTADNRLLVFARKPAPVQVTWLGYPSTTWLSTIDFRLTDAIADPEEGSGACHSETLIHLPGGFLCYKAPEVAPEVSPLPAQTAGFVTFGSFNNSSKVTPEVVAVWARIMRRIPGSHLLLKSHQFADATTRQRYVKLFVGYGIDAHRISLLPNVPSLEKHLGTYSRVDIALDTFPYNGTTTTCEALWMGVPVITLRGDRHAGRVGASLLARVELAELIAENEEAYVETAVSLAGDRGRLEALRTGLRARMSASPLCDSAGFARQVEAAYRDMWKQWCRKAEAT